MSLYELLTYLLAKPGAFPPAGSWDSFTPGIARGLHRPGRVIERAIHRFRSGSGGRDLTVRQADRLLQLGQFITQPPVLLLGRGDLGRQLVILPMPGAHSAPIEQSLGEVRSKPKVVDPRSPLLVNILLGMDLRCRRLPSPLLKRRGTSSDLLHGRLSLCSFLRQRDLSYQRVVHSRPLLAAVLAIRTG